MWVHADVDDPAFSVRRCRVQQWTLTWATQVWFSLKPVRVILEGNQASIAAALKKVESLHVDVSQALEWAEHDISFFVGCFVRK